MRCCWAVPREVQGDAAAGAASDCRQPNVGPHRSAGLKRPVAAPTIAGLLDGAELFLDAVLGTGFRPPMRGVATALGEWLAAHPEAPVVSVDLPSGWDADSRAMLQQGAYRSDAVVTFTAPKLAHVSGFLTRGAILVADIGSPDDVVNVRDRPALGRRTRSASRRRRGCRTAIRASSAMWASSRAPGDEREQRPWPATPRCVPARVW